MKIKFKKEKIIPFNELSIGDEFSTQENINKLFIKINTFNVEYIGKINCIDLSNGQPELISDNGIVIARKVSIIVK